MLKNGFIADIQVFIDWALKMLGQAIRDICGTKVIISICCIL